MESPSLCLNSGSSSSNLWATASREWVIAPKPKPGRKPKKDTLNISKSDNASTDSKGRRIQNRAAQRAFRERKQTQLAELQARVQSYEQGEIERNVALQNIAKRLKEENESLRVENAFLKEKLVQSGLALVTGTENNKRRPSGDVSSVSEPATKRPKPSENSILSPPMLTSTSTPSPSSTVYSTETPDNMTNIGSPLPCYDQLTLVEPSQLLGLSPMKPLPVDTSFPSFECGFCTEETSCMCREIVAHEMHRARMDLPSDMPTEHFQPNKVPSSDGILENLPPYQPAVPLRRRTATGNVNRVFAVTSQQDSPPTCSGDPSNCMACADDAFGKAFCEAIVQSTTSHVPCDDCPRKQKSATLPGIVSCNATCASASGCKCRSKTDPFVPKDSASETMPTNDAWRQIKAHPNVSFADLRLLAEVVAQKTICSGPMIDASPTLEQVEETTCVADGPPPMDHESIVLTDPHAHYREKERARDIVTSSPRLVPQEVLIRCGRQRIREVETDAVRAALRLLDAKFT
ncbi:hypothetical protein H0H93_004215 [Arthromyces matolae]|nr:hypothetical protein H0H93_004215 [Arthromyces matolae]